MNRTLQWLEYLLRLGDPKLGEYKEWFQAAQAMKTANAEHVFTKAREDITKTLEGLHGFHAVSQPAFDVLSRVGDEAEPFTVDILQTSTKLMDHDNDFANAQKSARDLLHRVFGDLAEATVTSLARDFRDVAARSFFFAPPIFEIVKTDATNLDVVWRLLFFTSEEFDLPTRMAIPRAASRRVLLLDKSSTVLIRGKPIELSEGSALLLDDVDQICETLDREVFEARYEFPKAPKTVKDDSVEDDQPGREEDS